MIFTGNVKSWDNLDLSETLVKKEIQQCCFVQESAGNGLIGLDHVGGNRGCESNESRREIRRRAQLNKRL